MTNEPVDQKATSIDNLEIKSSERRSIVEINKDINRLLKEMGKIFKEYYEEHDRHEKRMAEFEKKMQSINQ